MPKCQHCEKEAKTKGLCRNHYMQAWNREHKDSVQKTKSDYYQRNSERIKATTAAYAKNNAVKDREYRRNWMRAWCAANREEARRRTAEYRKKNPDKVEAYRKQYDLAHKAKNRERRADWRRRNPELNALYKARRRDRTKVGKLPRDVRERMAKIYRECRRITKETGVDHHVDHIIPLARGGEHHPDNLQIITAVENHRKHAKLPEEFA